MQSRVADPVSFCPKSSPVMPMQESLKVQLGSSTAGWKNSLGDQCSFLFTWLTVIKKWQNNLCLCSLRQKLKPWLLEWQANAEGREIPSVSGDVASSGQLFSLSLHLAVRFLPDVPTWPGVCLCLLLAAWHLSAQVARLAAVSTCQAASSPAQLLILYFSVLSS